MHLSKRKLHPAEMSKIKDEVAQMKENIRVMRIARTHRKAEWAACMKRIEAPVLWLASDRKTRIDAEPGGLAARVALLKRVVCDRVVDTSHNLHHDRPAEVARIVEAFLRGP
jgi:pimeloyl-ACP methyl ester carboxylesterase